MGEREQHKGRIHGSSVPDLATQEQEQDTWLVKSEDPHLGKMEAQRLLEPEQQSQNDI